MMEPSTNQNTNHHTNKNDNLPNKSHHDHNHQPLNSKGGGGRREQHSKKRYGIVFGLTSCIILLSSFREIRFAFFVLPLFDTTTTDFHMNNIIIYSSFDPNKRLTTLENTTPSQLPLVFELSSSALGEQEQQQEQQDDDDSNTQVVVSTLPTLSRTSQTKTTATTTTTTKTASTIGKNTVNQVMMTRSDDTKKTTTRKRKQQQQQQKSKLFKSPPLVVVNNNNTTTRFDHSIGACLLMKDDNHWLIEWLAYHYHVLPLRHLIFVRDPTSKTHPYNILARYNGLIQMEEWDADSANIVPHWVKRDYANGKLDTTRLHRFRQQFFYAKCMKYFKQQQQQPQPQQRRQRRANSPHWVIMMDTDEFVRPNPYYNHDNGETTLEHSYNLSEPGSVFKTIQRREQELKTKTKKTSPTCLHIPRLQISTRLDNSTNAATTTTSTPPFWKNGTTPFNFSMMMTTTWFYHNGHEITSGHNLDGKNMVHVSRVAHVPHKVPDVHNVLKECPFKKGPQKNDPLLSSSWLVIHHYPGTYEQYSFREDPRDKLQQRFKRNYAYWQSIGEKVYGSQTAEPKISERSVMTTWLPGFIQHVGLQQAQVLLEGVGQVGYQ